MNRKMGLNVRRLMIHKMSRDAVPDGGGLMDGVRFLRDPEAIRESAIAAEQWVRESLAAVKSAPDNPFGDDDELIAGEILRRIEGQKGAQ